MQTEAELHAEEDKKKQSLIEAKNLADNLIYASEKTLKESADKIPADLKKDAEEKIDGLKKAKEGDNIEEIKNKTQELSQAIQKVGAELYKQQPKQEEKPEDKPKNNEEPKAEEGNYTEK